MSSLGMRFMRSWTGLAILSLSATSAWAATPKDGLKEPSKEAFVATNWKDCSDMLGTLRREAEVAQLTSTKADERVKELQAKAKEAYSDLEDAERELEKARTALAKAKETDSKDVSEKTKDVAAAKTILEKTSEKAKEANEKLKDAIAQRNAAEKAEVLAIKAKDSALEVEEERVDFAKALSGFLKENFYIPNSREQLSRALQFSLPKLSRILGENPARDDLFAFLSDYDPKGYQRAQKALVKVYYTLAKEMGATPFFDELADHLRISEEALKTIIRPKGMFKDLIALKNEARLHKSFRQIIDRDIFNEKREKALMEAIRTKPRLILTTAVAGSHVQREFLSAMLHYAKENDATVIVYPVNMETDGLDPILLETPNVHILTNRIWLTPYLSLNHIKLTAKQLDPLTSIERMQQSSIVGAPQLRVKVIPTKNNEIEPRRIASTGAITLPYYDGGKYISQRTDALAEEVQEITGMGAYILERTNGRSVQMSQAIGEPMHGEYHQRHIEFIPEKHGFMDLNRFYVGENAGQPARTVAVRHEAWVLGDAHVGHTRQLLLAKIRELIKRDRPRRILVHDLLNGHSISHHDEDRQILMAQKLESGELDLAAEFADVVAFVNSLLSLDPELEVVVVSANHNDWLKRWLDRNGPSILPQNRMIGFYLQAAATQGHWALQHALLNGWGEPFQLNGSTYEVTGKVFPRVSDASRVIMLRPGQSFPVGKPGNGKDSRLVELGEHGHAGANGSRGSIKQFFNSGARMVFGHTHTDARINGVVNVATFTHLKQGYNDEGLSSWMNSFAFVGENGEIQSVVFADDQWFAEPGVPEPKSEEFFAPNYPQLVPNNRYKGWGGQVDSWNSVDKSRQTFQNGMRIYMDPGKIVEVEPKKK